MRNLVIAATALAFTGTAYAADMPLIKAPPVPVAPSWTGFYLGVNGGYSWGTVDTGTGLCNNDPAIGAMCPDTYFKFPGVAGGALTDNRYAVSNQGSNVINNKGGLVGGQIGYLLQAGTLVAGLEVGFDWMDAKGSAATSANYPHTPASSFAFNQSVSSDWLLTFLGRVGFDLGAWFPYATAGLAIADLKYTSTFTDTFRQGGSDFTQTSVKPGVAAGAGVEWRWDAHWSLRGEYLYMAFNSLGGPSTVCDCSTAGTHNAFFNNKATFSENVARAALSYKW